jgi:hypothetical protein
MIPVISSIEGCGNLAANEPTDLQSSGVWEPCKLPMIPLIFSIQGCGNHADNGPTDLQSSGVWEAFCLWSSRSLIYEHGTMLDLQYSEVFELFCQ